MGDSVYIATPEAGLVGVHGWDGNLWQRILVSSGDLLRVAKTAGEAYGDGITPLDFVVDTDEDDNNVMPLVNPMMYNEATLDRMRGNTKETILASAVRSVTTISDVLYNYNARGAIFILRCTVAPGGETLAMNVYALDPVSGANCGIAAFATILSGATGTPRMIVYPGAVETIAMASVHVQGLPLPREYKIEIVHSASGDWTYSVGGYPIL